MATLTSNYLTLADFARRLDPDGKPALIAEMLSQENEILEDLIFQEANGPVEGYEVKIWNVIFVADSEL